jgi:hypothetical protein
MSWLFSKLLHTCSRTLELCHHAYVYGGMRGRQLQVLVEGTYIILKWNHSQTGAHRLDENLSEISLIAKEAFEPSLPLSAVPATVPTTPLAPKNGVS